MKMEPIWDLKSAPTAFESLQKNSSVDVAIIGGGITGITTAQFLSQHGFKVAVLEARKVGQGTTGQSTGNLYGITEYPLQELISKYNTATVQQVVLARLEAMNHIQHNAADYGLDCDLKLQPMYLFEKESSLNIQKELKLAAKIGLPAWEIQAQDFPFDFDQGMVFENQLQFNPLAYTQNLARHIASAECRIYEDTPVLDIEEKDDQVILKANDFTVKAKYVVHASHTPKGLQVQYHTTLGPYREYGIGVKLKSGNYPEGIFWGHYGEKKFSVRSYGPDDNRHLICVGSMHKVGQEDDNRKNIAELGDFVKRHFDVAAITHEWGGQNYKAADLLPYIGQKTSGSREYVATGYSTDGLVYGTLAAKLISDEIAGVENKFAKFFKASRHHPLKAGKKFTKETVNVVGQLVGDFFKKGEDEKIAELPPDTGKLLQYADGKYAVYKNAEGEVSAFSPICPHMGCTVHWNHAEKTWDCPCHGSRFDTAGQVIEGPAYKGLELIE